MALHQTTQSLSLETLFDQAADTVYGFVLSRCGDIALAEDLTAATFEAASQRFNAGRDGEVTVPWLITVARRRLVDHWRSQAAQTRRFDRLVQLASPPDEDQILRDTAVDEALASLPTRYRAALSLRYLDDFAINEVADALDLTYKATESLLARARHAFAAAYGAQT